MPGVKPKKHCLNFSIQNSSLSFRPRFTPGLLAREKAKPVQEAVYRSLLDRRLLKPPERADWSVAAQHPPGLSLEVPTNHDRAVVQDILPRDCEVAGVGRHVAVGHPHAVP